MITRQRRHGLTLTETLVSLSMLAVLAGAVVSWTTTAARSASRSSSDQAWHAAATAVLDQIATDARAGDFHEDDRQPKLVHGQDMLSVRTRASGVGPTTRRYTLRNSELVVQTRGVDDQPVVLLGGVSLFDLETLPGGLAIMVGAGSGLRVERVVAVPDAGSEHAR